MVIRYVIVPEIDAKDNYKMLNQSLSRSFDHVRKNNDESYYLFSFATQGITDPVPDSFLSYQIYLESEIQDALDSSWDGVV